MSRQTRLIVIIAGMALLSVVILGVVAERYSKLIERQKEGPGQSAAQAAGAALAQVDAFVRVRLALREAIDAGTFEGVEGDARALAFSAERHRVLSAARVHEADYRELRARYRQWVREPSRLSGVWLDAFESRKQELAACGLGRLEPLDR